MLPLVAINEDRAEFVHFALCRGNYQRIADKTGLARSHVSRVLREKTGATLDVAARIADAAGVTMDELREYIETSGDRK